VRAAPRRPDLVPGGSPPALRALQVMTSGVVVGVLVAVLATSAGSLVFAVELHEFRAAGIGLALLSTVIVGLVAALAGSLPGTVAFSQLATGALLAVMAAGAVAALPADAEPTSRFMTVVALLALTTLATGALFLAIGLFRLGRLVRYLPYPVVGGFVAGVGWLLVAGGIRVMTDVSPSTSYLADLAAPGLWPRWLPGVALALLVVVVTERARHPLAFPALIAAATAGLYLALAVSGATIDEWRAAGHLLGPFPDAGLLQPLRPHDLDRVAWEVVLEGAVIGSSVVLMALLSNLVNATALEVDLERPVDLDRDLRSTGLANLLAGSLGGPLGYPALSLTLLNHRLGGASRATSLVAVAVVGVTLLRGGALLELVPTLVVGSVLVYLGLTFLIEWIVRAHATLTRIEYGIVVAILLTVAAAGFVEGVAVGTALTVAQFVVTYGRVDAVKHALTGESAASRVNWGPAQRERLRRLGERTLVLQLHGFLFFGSAAGLVERVERRLAGAPRLAHLVIDFRLVSGIDATASASFARLVRLADERGFALVVAALGPGAARVLERAAAAALPGGAAQRFATLDEALEWCERRTLAAADAEEGAVAAVDEGSWRVEGMRPQDLLRRLERLEIDAGTSFIDEGAPSDSLYLVASGRVTAELGATRGRSVRLETMTGGTLVGEIGFYTGAPRGATVRADEPTVVYRLTHETLAALAADDPRLVASLHRLVARTLADRVAHLQRAVAALSR
jgi:sulfate permease, SulP family